MTCTFGIVNASRSHLRYIQFNTLAFAFSAFAYARWVFLQGGVKLDMYGNNANRQTKLLGPQLPKVGLSRICAPTVVH